MTHTPKKKEEKKPDELTNDEVLEKVFPKKVVKELKKITKKDKDGKDNNAS